MHDFQHFLHCADYGHNPKGLFFFKKKRKKENTDPVETNFNIFAKE